MRPYFRITTPALTLASVLSFSLMGSPVFAQNGEPFIPKRTIERPTEKIFAELAAPAPRNLLAAEENPAVPPGKVRWHANFDAACQAAQKSGKPVLLFQMLGQLDKQFC